MKKCISLLAVVIMLFSLSGCGIAEGAFLFFLAAAGDDSADKEAVFDFVRENAEELLDAIGKNDFSAFENQGFIRDVLVNGTVVDFSCGGAGMGAETFYVGFYYTPNEDLTAVQWAPSSAQALVPSGNGYRWQQESGDNTYYVEKICDGFYYYEASF